MSNNIAQDYTSKDKVKDVYLLLNEFVGDIVIASRLPDIANKGISKPETYQVGRILYKFAISMIAITLVRFLELFEFIGKHNLLPKDHRTKYKTFCNSIKSKPIEKIRHSLVAHNLDKDLKWKLPVCETIKLLYELDPDGKFFDWVKTYCIPNIEALRSDILSYHSLDMRIIHDEELRLLKEFENELSRK
ncbi:MAG: hypothetical protein HZA00_06910 [Nitrospinae bacterium]|nr:hypothetical protein [Nitrospinota bacterium]